MFRFSAVVVAVVLTACGRYAFDGRSDGDLVGIDDVAALDTPVGASCTTDAECGRCARCDASSRCAVEPIADLFLGHRSACYTGVGGERWCTGFNTSGQLGLGDTANRSTPERAVDGGGWTSIKITYYGDSIGEAGGQFFRWGNGTLLPEAIGASRPLRGLLGDVDTPCYWEMDGTSSCPGAGVVAWTSLSVGGAHTCGIQGDGSLWCWGINRSNALGDASLAEEENVAAPLRVGLEQGWVRVAAGGKGIATANGGRAMSCATKTDGRIYCWGHRALTGTNNVDVGATPTAVSPDTDWTWLQLDWEHACAGKANGSVWCWGTDTYGGYVVPGQTSALVPTQVAGTFTRWLMGGHHACGLEAGRWRCFGLNDEGQLGIGTTTTTGQFVDLCP